MPTTLPELSPARYDFQVNSLDLSQVVGFQVKIFSEQFPGKELRTRVIAHAGDRLTTESGHKHEAVDNLVNHQEVILQFPYRGQEISVKARLQKSGTGQCYFDLDRTVSPLSHRRFHRIELIAKVNLAPFPTVGLLSRKLDRLRWMETSLHNFSAGGALLSVPTKLPDSVRLLVNIQQEHFGFPALTLANVRHSYQFDEIHCRAGVEFVTRELADRMFSPYQMSGMPPVLFTYSNTRREVLDRAVKEWDATINRREDTGVDNEGE